MRLASRPVRHWGTDLARKAVVGLAVPLLTVAISTSIASAACNPPKYASTSNAMNGDYAYWRTTIYDGSGRLFATFSSGATDHTGTCNALNFLSSGIDYHVIGMSLNLGESCVVGCPSGSLTMDVRVIDASQRQEQMVMVKVPETHSTPGLVFDFSNTAHDMCNVPRPVITDLSSNGSTKTATLSIGSMAACAFGDALQEITGWNILSRASSTQPGIFDSYGLRGSLVVTPGSDGSASGTVTLDCSNPALDQWVTAQLVTGGAVVHLVGPTTRVICQSGSASCSGVAEGTTCDDGSACTFHDTCQLGACVSGTPVICTASDQCHDVGACNPANGTCSNPDAADGTACDDGSACTVGDDCGGGVCNGTTITAPPETQDVAASADKTTYSWSAATYATRYDVVRGSTGAFPVGPGGGDEVCFDNLAVTTLTDPAAPAPATGFWYLSRGQNECGVGTFGSQSNGLPRTTTTCP